MSVASSGTAPLASPALTGTPTAPTPAAGDSSSKLATTGFVAASYAPLASPALTGSPTAPTPAAGDSSTRIATTAFLGTFVPLASPAFSGAPTAPTPVAGDNSGKLATTGFVVASFLTTANAQATYAPLASPTFTGTPTAPTAAAGTATTQAASTAFVQNAVAGGGVAALRYDVAQALSAAQQGQARANAGLNAAGAVAFRNRLINGNLAVNQRGAASASTAYAAGAYVMDRWKAGANGCTLSFAAAANGDVTATVTAGTLCQVIEGGRYLPEGGAYVLSWSGTATARVYQGSAAGSYAAAPVAATGLTAGTNATVEFGTGTLTLAQFEPGATATPFERRDDELRRCQRYCAILPIAFTAYASASGQYVGAGLPHPVEMRAAPSLTPPAGGTATNVNTAYEGIQAVDARTSRYYMPSANSGLFEVYGRSSIATAEL